MKNQELKTVHNDTTVEQSFTPEDKYLGQVEITATHKGTDGFDRLNVKEFSEFWLSIQVSEVKKGRAYSRSISIPKEHVTMLAECLTQLASTMKKLG